MLCMCVGKGGDYFYVVVFFNAIFSNSGLDTKQFFAKQT